MKTMRDTEVRLTPPMLRHALRGWRSGHLQDDELIECFAAAVEADERREAIERVPVVCLYDDDGEIALRLRFSPVPAVMVINGDVYGTRDRSSDSTPD